MRNGRGGQNRTVTTSSQDSDAYVTPHPEFENGGTERTRTVIDLIDNQVPHPSATVPLRENLGGSKGVEPSRAAVTVRCSTELSYDPQTRATSKRA